MRIQYMVEPTPQGNKTMRYRAVLSESQQISKQPIPFVYVTKDWWNEHDRPFYAHLVITPRTETVGEYLLVKGKNNHKIVHVDAMGVPPREANAVHHLPFVYMSGAYYDQHGMGAESFDLELEPEL